MPEKKRTILKHKMENECLSMGDLHADICNACITNQIEKVQTLLQIWNTEMQDMEPQQYDERSTFLKCAAANGNLENVKLLMRDGVEDCDVGNGYEALDAAISEGHFAVMHELLKCKPQCELNIQKATEHARVDKSVPIPACTSKQEQLAASLFDHCKNGMVKEVELFLQQGIDINTVYDNKSLLYHAAKNGHEQIVKLLLQKGAVLVGNLDKCFALACRHDSIFILQYLLQLGADINGRWNFFDFPLLEGCQYSNVSIIQFLLQHESQSEKLKREVLRQICQRQLLPLKVPRKTILQLLLQHGTKYDNHDLYYVQGTQHDLFQVLQQYPQNFLHV